MSKWLSDFTNLNLIFNLIEKNNTIKRILATTSFFLLEPSHLMIGYHFSLLDDGTVRPL